MIHGAIATVDSTPIDFSAPSPDAPKRVTIADAFRARRERGPVVHEPTGLRELDRFTRGGPTYGTRIYVVGAPDASKTLLLFQIAHDYAKRGIPVGFFGVDEDIDDLHTRMVQRTAFDGSQGGKHFTRGDYETASANVLDLMVSAVGDLPFVYYDASWTVEAAGADLARYAKEFGKRAAFFVDSVQTVECAAIRGDVDMSERRRVTENVQAIRSVATDHHMIVMATSESNREWYKAIEKGEKVSAMSAGAESRAVEFSARVLLALSRRPDDESVIEVAIPKNKLGPREEPAFYLGLDRERQTLVDVAAPPPVSKPPGPSPKQNKQRQEQEARRRETKLREEQEREERAVQRERAKAAQLASDREAACAILLATPDITVDEFRADMRNRTGGGTGRADAARRWVQHPKG